MTHDEETKAAKSFGHDSFAPNEKFGESFARVNGQSFFRGSIMDSRSSLTSFYNRRESSYRATTYDRIDVNGGNDDTYN
mgnify:CR=1 FL=1